MKVEKHINKKLILVSTIIMIIYIMVPAVIIIPRALRLSLMGLSIILFYIGIILISRKLFAKILLISIVIVIFDLIIYYSQWNNYTDVFTKSYNLFIFWYPLIQSFYYINLKDKSKLQFIFRLILLVTAITATTTIIGLNEFPLASRDLASPANDGSIYLYHNIGGYGYVYSLVFLIPYLLYLFKKSRSILSFVLIILINVCIIKAEYTIAFLLTILSLINLFFKNFNLRRAVFLIIIGVTIFNIFTLEIAKLINHLIILLNDFEINFIAYRLEQVYNSILANELLGGVANRIELYKQSIGVFIETPIWGNLFNIKGTVGGHSEIFDLLGSSGIFGFSIFIFIMSQYRLQVLNKLKKLDILNYTWYVLTVFLILGCINTLFMSPQISLIVFFVPSCIRCLEMELNKKQTYRILR